MTKPLLCLSIKQPWSWLICQGYKPIENRSWFTPYRGLLVIHAGKGMTMAEYLECDAYASSLFVAIPPYAQLERGGIVGIANLVDCVQQHESLWFEGPYGWVLEDARPIEFIPCPGELKLFSPSMEIQNRVREAVQIG